MSRNLRAIFAPLIIISLFAGSLQLFTANPAPVSAATTRQIINLGVMVQFADSDTVAPKRADGTTPFHINDPDNLANAEKLLNSDTPIDMETSAGTISVPSIKKYYETQSYGQLSITTKLLPDIYKDSHKMSYYLPQSITNPDGYTANNMRTREADLAKSIAAFANSKLDATIQVDLLTFFIEPAVKLAGTTGNYTNGLAVRSGDMLWSHVRSENLGSIAGQAMTSYAIIYQAPLVMPNGSYDVTAGLTFSLRTSAYGTIAHELGHLLGFKDLYRSDYGTNSQFSGPVEIFDLMGKTISSNPQNLSAYLVSEFRDDLKWHNPLPVIDKTTTGVTVSQPQFIDPSERRAVKIQRNPSDQEYFIVEYYQPHDTRDRYSADSKGIIIYRVNEQYASTGNYHAYDATTFDPAISDDHIYIFRPGETTLGAGAGNLLQAPLNLDRKTLGKDLNGSTTFDKQTIYYSDGSNSGIVITVTAMTDNSVTFDVNLHSVPGNGTAASPYLISNTLDYFYLMQGDTTGKHYKLTSNLDFRGITYPQIDFSGHFDGNNHTLSNITATGSGVFASIGDNGASSIKNLQVTNLTVKPQGGSTLGGLAASAVNATFDNVHLRSGTITNIASINSFAATGGFIGSLRLQDDTNPQSSRITINNCSAALTVNAVQNVGGFIGFNRNAKLSNVSTSSKVTGTTNVGAFIGTQLIVSTGYNTPLNATYSTGVNPGLPAVGKAYNATTWKFETTPNSLSQGITAATTTVPNPNPNPTPTPEPEKPDPTPTPTPTPEVTPTTVFSSLSLTPKSGDFLFGFNIDSSINSLVQQLTSKNATSVQFRDTNNATLTTGTIATGVKLTFKIGQTAYNYTAVIKGDTTGDGRIQATDYVKIRNHIMGKSQLSGAYLQAADIDQNGELQATDYVKIRNHIMGKSAISQK